jgi:hypothetical protein
MRSAVLLPGAVLFLAACGSATGTGTPTAANAAKSATPTAAQASPTLAPIPNPLLVFAKAGALSLVWPDGTVAHEVQTAYTTLGAGSNQFDGSGAVLISRDYAVQAVLTRDGATASLAPAAAALLDTNSVESDLATMRPILIDDHMLLGVEVSGPMWNYIELDLTSGKVTTLLSVKEGPSQGFPQVANMLALGTTLDRSVAHVFVNDVIVNGETLTGGAYFDIDLSTGATTGPRALPAADDPSSIAISADGRYAAWLASGTGLNGAATWDLHILDLTTGSNTTLRDAPYVNAEGSVVLRFSPDDRYVSLEGFAGPAVPSSYGYMGIAIVEVDTARIVRFVDVTHVSVDGISTVGWTGPDTLVYTTTVSASTVGHSLDVQSGSDQEYPVALGAPVLMLR